MTLSKQNRSQLATTLAAVIAEVSSRHNPEDAAAAIWPARFAEQALLQSSRFVAGSDDYRSALRSARSEIQTIREIAALGIMEVNRLTAEKQLADRKRGCAAYIAEREGHLLAGGSDRQMRRWREQLNKGRQSLLALSAVAA